MTTVQAVYKDCVLHLLHKLNPEEIKEKFLHVELVQEKNQTKIFLKCSPTI